MIDDSNICNQNVDENANQAPPKKKSKKKKKLSAQVVVGLDWLKVPDRDEERNSALVLSTREGSISS